MTQETPQEALTAVLTAWQRRDYAELARLKPLRTELPNPPRAPTRKEVRTIGRIYRGQALRSFRILRTHDTDPAAANVYVELLCDVQGTLELWRRRYRMIHLSEAGQPVPRAHPDGRWVPCLWYSLPDPPSLRA